MTKLGRAAFTGNSVDGFEGDRVAVFAIARALWHRRELAFPERVRRMEPDALDMATGAWSSCVLEAIKHIRERSDGEEARETKP